MSLLWILAWSQARKQLVSEANAITRKNGNFRYDDAAQARTSGLPGSWWAVTSPRVLGRKKLYDIGYQHFSESFKTVQYFRPWIIIIFKKNLHYLRVTEANQRGRHSRVLNVFFGHKKIINSYCFEGRDWRFSALSSGSTYTQEMQIRRTDFLSARI